MLRDDRVAADRGLPGAGADAHVTVVERDRGQRADPVEVDQVLEPGQAQRQHRHEALTPGEGLRFVAVLGEECGDLIDRRRGVQLERGRLHPPRASRSTGFALPDIGVSLSDRMVAVNVTGREPRRCRSEW